MSILYDKLVNTIENIKSIAATMPGPKILVPNILRESSLEDICELYLEMTKKNFSKFKKDTNMSSSVCLMYAMQISRYIYDYMEDIWKLHELLELWSMNVVWLNIDRCTRESYIGICKDYGKKPPGEDTLITDVDVERLKRKITGIVRGSITPFQAGILLYHNETYRVLLRDVFDVTVSRK